MTNIGSILGVVAFVILVTLSGAASFGVVGAAIGLLIGIGIVFGAVKALEAMKAADRSDWMR
jgi:predicted benzoate:H+ symporter BenE